jgi:prepilin peptidase CpaA
MPQPSLVPLLLAVLVSAIAAAWDLRTGEIPNGLTALGAAATLVAVALGAPDLGALMRAISTMATGLLIVSIVPVMLFRAGGMGGGDVKLLAVVGAALGPYAGIEAELYAFVTAMLYAPVRLIWEGKLLAAMKKTGSMAVRPLLPKHRRPPKVALETLTALRFGPAIFVGTLLTFLQHLGGVR